MQPITLTEEQHEFRRVLRQFCDAKIAPLAATNDERAEYSWETFRALQSMELTALQLPAEYGGAGADLVTQAIAVEELARADASASLTFLISKLGMLPVINFGSEELKKKYIPRIATGEMQASYCLSEADAGSDVASMRTRAERDGEDYVITGNKVWITNAGVSDVYLVFASTDPSAGHRGITAFLLEKEWGVQVTKLEHKLGVRASPTGQLAFDEVRVPVANRVGEEGQGFYIAMHTLDRSRPTIGAQAVGIAQGALEVATAYARDRKQFGKRIGDLQMVGAMLADMDAATEAARQLLYKACVEIEAGAPDASRWSAMCKLVAGDAAMRVTTDAVQVLGGYGYIDEFPVERMMRDAKLTQLYEGTQQIQRLVVARALLGKDS
jgi:alkylation response protein AidB-like acyl-CoA dehydrogenase